MGIKSRTEVSRYCIINNSIWPEHFFVDDGIFRLRLIKSKSLLGSVRENNNEILTSWPFKMANPSTPAISPSNKSGIFIFKLLVDDSIDAPTAIFMNYVHFYAN